MRQLSPKKRTKQKQSRGAKRAEAKDAETDLAGHVIELTDESKMAKSTVNLPVQAAEKNEPKKQPQTFHDYFKSELSTISENVAGFMNTAFANPDLHALAATGMGDLAGMGSPSAWFRSSSERDSIPDQSPYSMDRSPTIPEGFVESVQPALVSMAATLGKAHQRCAPMEAPTRQKSRSRRGEQFLDREALRQKAASLRKRLERIKAESNGIDDRDDIGNGRDASPEPRTRGRSPLRQMVETARKSRSRSKNIDFARTRSLSTTRNQQIELQKRSRSIDHTSKNLLDSGRWTRQGKKPNKTISYSVSKKKQLQADKESRHGRGKPFFRFGGKKKKEIDTATMTPPRKGQAEISDHNERKLATPALALKPVSRRRSETSSSRQSASQESKSETIASPAIRRRSFFDRSSTVRSIAASEPDITRMKKHGTARPTAVSVGAGQDMHTDSPRKVRSGIDAWFKSKNAGAPPERSVAPTPDDASWAGSLDNSLIHAIGLRPQARSSTMADLENSRLGDQIPRSSRTRRYETREAPPPRETFLSLELRDSDDLTDSTGSYEDESSTDSRERSTYKTKRGLRLEKQSWKDLSRAADILSQYYGESNQGRKLQDEEIRRSLALFREFANRLQVSQTRLYASVRDDVSTRTRESSVADIDDGMPAIVGRLENATDKFFDQTANTMEQVFGRVQKDIRNFGKKATSCRPSADEAADHQTVQEARGNPVVSPE